MSAKFLGEAPRATRNDRHRGWIVAVTDVSGGDLALELATRLGADCRRRLPAVAMVEIDGEGTGALAAHLGAALPAWRDLGRGGYGGLLRGRLAEHPSGLHLADSGPRRPLATDERLEDFVAALSDGYDGTILILQGWDPPVPAVFALSDLLLLAIGPGPVAMVRAGRWQRRVREAHLFESHIRAVPWGAGASPGLMSETLGWPAWEAGEDLVDRMLSDIPQAGARATSGRQGAPDAGESAEALRRRLHREVVERLNRVRQEAGADGGKPGHARRESVIREVETVLAESTPEIRPHELREALARDLVADLLGYGPLEILLADPDITEILVNGPGQIFVERGGRLEACPVRFPDADALRVVIERILGPVGRRADESVPLADARLPDGSRVNVVLPPLSLNGPTVTIRRFPAHPLGPADLLAAGTFEAGLASFLEAAVRARRNILVSGGTGSGKTTLLNVMGAWIPSTDRIVTIEDAAELRLPQEHVVRLESRPPNLEGAGEIPIRRLVMNALRMRPDRIIVGECRGGEALDMLQAMNTGHDGSLTTVHANSPRDALKRLETLVIMAGLELPSRAIREQIGSAIHLVVQVARLEDGARRVVAVSEVTGLEGDVLCLADLFSWDASSRASRPTGITPACAPALRLTGWIGVDP